MSLATISTAVLDRLRSRVASGAVGIPLSPLTLASEGLPSVLAALGRDSLLAVIDAVLAERSASRGPAVELVWTGPEARSSGARDTAVVVQSLFSRAQRRILIAGFRFDNGGELLGELHVALRDRGVVCQLFGDEGESEKFLKRNWPFGPPYPQVFAFRTAKGTFSSLHAKCIVVDGICSLVTSANFTDRGQTRNIEVGALVEDQAFAHALERQFQSAAALGAFEELRT